MNEDEDKFDVTIKGQITGFNIATEERVQKLGKELQRQEKTLNDFMKQVKEQKALLDVINLRIDRLESYLSSYTRTK